MVVQAGPDTRPASTGTALLASRSEQPRHEQRAAQSVHCEAADLEEILKEKGECGVSAAGPAAATSVLSLSVLTLWPAGGLHSQPQE